MLTERHIARAASFAIGLFTIAAQTSLLREYLVVFKGSELALGLFFSAWFLGIALASTLSTHVVAIRSWSVRNAYILIASQPLLAVGSTMFLATVRGLIGVESYEPTPPLVLAIGAMVATLPICVITGLAFPASCDRSGQGPIEGASLGYVAETIGALLGGIVATIAFGLGLEGIVVTTGTGVIPMAVAAIALRASRLKVALIAVLLVIGSIPSIGLPHWLAKTRLEVIMPGFVLEKELNTPYQRVTIAKKGGQYVVLANGAIIAVFPYGPDVDADEALLAVQPDRHKLAIVVGQDRYALAAALTRHFDEVRVVSLDRAALDAMEEARLAAGGASIPRLVRVVSDERAYLRDIREQIDLLVIGALEPDTLLTNRLYTREFLEEVAKHLAPGGVIVAQARSAENFIGTEVQRYGQSIYATLKAVYNEVVIVPGEIATFLASHSHLSLDANILAERYRAIGGGPFPPEGFYTRLQPDRASYIAGIYSEPTPADLVNRDEKPVATLMWLMAFLRMAGMGGSHALWKLYEVGSDVALALLFVFFIVALRYRVGRSSESAGLLVGVAGGVSIAATIALLCSYQTNVGSVFSEIGAASALSMAGMAFGAAVGRRFAGHRFATTLCVTVIALFLWIASVAINSLHGMDTTSVRFITGILLVLISASSGATWSVAAAVAGQAAAFELEAADHWGAALLSAIAGVVCVAMLGVSGTLAMLAGLAAVVLLVSLFGLVLKTQLGESFSHCHIGRALTFGPRREIGTVLTFLALSFIAIYHVTKSEPPGLDPRISTTELSRYENFTADDERLSPFAHHLLSGVRRLERPTASTSNEAIVVASRAVAPEVTGYGGPLNVVVSIGADGKVRGVHIRHHSETPSYVTGLPAFLKTFEDRDIRDGCTRSGSHFDAMTGATKTMQAVEKAVGATCQAVGSKVLGLDIHEAVAGSALSDPALWWVVASLILMVLTHRFANRWWRLAFLAACFVIGGVIFNIQLSTQWLISLARLEIPSITGNLPFAILTFAIIVLAVLFGPLYCSHMCPFGALQELVGTVTRVFHLHKMPPDRVYDIARLVKYALLAMVFMMVLSADPMSWLKWDPLSSVFSGRVSGVVLLVIALALLGSALVFRFWCRFFCPVGAFFLLFNRTAGFFGLTPKRAYSACDLGITGSYDIECLQCNRCTRQKTEKVRQGRAMAIVFMVMMTLTISAVAWITFSRAPSTTASTGARELDTVKVMEMIREGRLSDHEARFWRPIEP